MVIQFRSIVILAVLSVFSFLACEAEGPIKKTIGPTQVEGNLEITSVKFGTMPDSPVKKTIKAEEGRLTVPENRSNPTGRTVQIHFVRFSATGKTPGYPTVYLAGGPGGSGTYSSAGDRFPLFMAMREVGDVIALDQRGCYMTEPYMVCPGSWDYPLDKPSDPDILAKVMAPFLKQCVEEWSGKADLSAFNTRENVADLEDLRKSLGAEKLNLWGISYGTHLGLAYIRRYPERVNRAVLAGVDGPDHTYKLPANIDRVLMRVADAVAADPAARGAIPDFIGSVKALLAQLEAEPLQVEIQDPETKQRHTVALGPLDVQKAIFGLLCEREDIEELVVRALPVLQGDYTSMALWAYQDRRKNLELVMTLAMDCASGATAERLETIHRQAETALVGKAGSYSIEAKCAGWPANDLGDDFRSPIRSEVPVLFISGTLDGKTPPSNAEEVLHGFPNGRHLIIEGGSHDDDLFLSSPRIAEAMVGFLKGEDPDLEPIILPKIRFRIP